jgi:flagellar protein FlaG
VKGSSVGPPNAQRASADSGVTADAQLREPITAVASEASEDRSSTLASISEVANDIREAIDTLNAALAKSPTKAVISRDDQLNRYIVKITDKQSGEVIREVPSEAVLKFARNLQEIKGLLFDKLL